ncbi:MAG: hypothetical protein CMN30_10780 [Sandaracinus sp.]|nr:hypothetical protein [Sandaracinus sp.]
MRLAAAMRLDARVQARNQLLPISVVVAALGSGMLAWLSTPERLARTVPLGVLAFVGGSTLLYVMAMIVLERADGTLAALIVSPLRPAEYLGSKVVTLTTLASIEAAILVGGTYGLLAAQGESAPLPRLALLALGVVVLGVLHVLLGVVIVVPHRRLMDVLVPMSLVALVLQAPAVWFVGAVDAPWLLAIPSAPPTMLVRGAFVPLAPWEWAYGLGGSAFVIAVAVPWALRRFRRHVVEAGG